MKAEFGHLPGWVRWYESRKPSTAIRELLKKMNDVRVRATKTKPLKTRTLANVTIPPEEVTPKVLTFLQAGAAGQVQLEPIDPTNTVFLVKVGGEVLAKAHLKSAEHGLPEFEGRDSKDVCRDYLTELESLVSECHARFKP